MQKAVELADAGGDIAAVTSTTLAAALGIRPPSLYNHITSLDDLHYAMTSFGVDRLLADLRGASLGLVGRDALTAMADAYRAFAHRHPGLYPLTVRAPEPGEADLIALSQEMVQWLLLVMASLGVHGDDAIHAIRGLRAVLHGFVALEAASGYKMALDPNVSYRRLVEVYLDGLGLPVTAALLRPG